MRGTDAGKGRNESRGGGGRHYRKIPRYISWYSSGKKKKRMTMKRALYTAFFFRYLRKTPPFLA